jgi:hypothetical protein
MKPVSQEICDENLGFWADSTEPDSLSLTLEKSDTNLEFFVSGRCNNVKLFHRPMGFQLINTGEIENRRNFCLQSTDIKVVELFPQKSVSEIGKVRWSYILISGLCWLLLGSATQELTIVMSLFLYGVLFGAILSLGTETHSRIVTVKLALTDNSYFVFSCEAKYSARVVTFFRKANPNNFVMY